MTSLYIVRFSVGEDIRALLEQHACFTKQKEGASRGKNVYAAVVEAFGPKERIDLVPVASDSLVCRRREDFFNYPLQML